MGGGRRIATTALAVVALIEYVCLAVAVGLMAVEGTLQGGLGATLVLLITVVGCAPGVVTAVKWRRLEDRVQALVVIPWLLLAACISPLTAYVGAMMGAVMIMGVSDASPLYVTMPVGALVGASLPYVVAWMTCCGNKPGSKQNR